MGTEKSPGFKIFSLSGHVASPGQYEAPLGITLRELLDATGGMREGHELKFWTPGGSSTPLFTAEHLDVPLDFEGPPAHGSMLGTTALQLFDETTCVVRAVLRWSEFYAHESCGKCTPCREGVFWYVQILERLERGEGDEQDLETLLDVSDNILGRAFCALGDGATSPVTSSIQYFRDEYIAALQCRRLPIRPGRLDRLRGSRRLMTVTTPPPAGSSASSARPPAKSDLVNLTVDGFEISVPKGTLVIRAAEFLGIQVPRFCEHPLLDPVGACRQCLVEVEGQQQAHGVVHDHGHRGHDREDAVHLGRLPRRRRTASSNCCWSTTRSTARCATRAVSARSRTRR